MAQSEKPVSAGCRQRCKQTNVTGRAAIGTIGIRDDSRLAEGDCSSLQFRLERLEVTRQRPCETNRNG